MAVKIRLSRIGSKGQPAYRVVVADERAARNGRTIEIVGQYNPLVEPLLFKVDKEKVLKWIEKGAQPTLIVRKLLGMAGILKKIDYANYKKRAPKQKGAKEEAAAPTAAVATPAVKSEAAKPAEQK